MNPKMQLLFSGVVSMDTSSAFKAVAGRHKC